MPGPSQHPMEYDIIEKDYSKYLCITKAEDDQPGVPFSAEEITALWQHVDTVPYVNAVLILVYTGWRISELLGLKTTDVDLDAWTMTGGIKTSVGKNRIVPIHSGIRDLVRHYHNSEHLFFLTNPAGSRPMTKNSFYKVFSAALESCRIQASHTPHDCRHTFVSLLDSAGANEVCIDRLVGHTSKSLTKRTYTHKDIEELRQAVELIKSEPPA